MGVLALRGVAMQTGDNVERSLRLREQADAMYKDKYIAWECGETELKIGYGVVNLKQTGRIRIPFGIPGSGEKEAISTASYENHLLSPVSFVRTYRKILGGE